MTIEWPLVVALLHSVVLAFTAAELARCHGRPRVPWAIGAFFFGELTLIGLLLRRREVALNHICPLCRGVHSARVGA